MKITTVRNTGANRLLLLFTGWSTDERILAGNLPEGWDVAVAYDYSSLEPAGHLFDKYSAIYLFAWSLGVAAAAATLEGVKIDAAFAINGTEHPANDELGIPEAIFTATRERLDERNLRKFRRRMFDSALDFEQAAALLPESDDIELLKKQLSTMQSSSPKADIPWRRAYVALDDRIIPADNQMKAWQEHPARPEIVSTHTPHFINAAAIISACTPDIPAISRRFEKALSTYDSHAEAQRIIADRLLELTLRESVPCPAVLEIGAGSGMFTRLYGPKLRPRSATFVDLYPTPRYNIAPLETYITKDAEQAASDGTLLSGFELILSASAIQWFAAPAAFFRNASRLLTDNGALICSSFAPGNLHELNTARPAPLLYHSAGELREMCSRSFGEVSVSEEEIILKFDSPREALLHLKHTGVAGGTHSRSAISLLRALKRPDGTATLTYRPIYILARNPRRQ